MSTQGSTVSIHRADERFVTSINWLDSKHSFSFGPHFDPSNVGHGLLIVSNDDKVAAGGGFQPHSHRDMEIVTWVLDGQLEHRDSEGNHGVLYPGLAQRMSAGTGITHSEMNHSRTDAVHFVQMWVPPDTVGVPPSYEQRDVNDQLSGGNLVTVASGSGDGAIKIHQAGASMAVARLKSGQTVDVPDSPYAHVFVAKGAVTISTDSQTQRLDQGDAARLTSAGALEVTADGANAEIIVWQSETEARR